MWVVGESSDDASSPYAVELRLTSHTAGRRRPAIVDLSDVEFIASLGIGMLVGAARALDIHRTRMVLLSPREPVDAVLRMAAIDRVVPIASNREEALRLLGLAP